MGTSSLELLDAIATFAASSAKVNVETADDAVRALHHFGRALAEVGHDLNEAGDVRRTRRRLIATELAATTRRAAGQWSPGAGRLTDLAGAAADAIVHRVPGRSVDECWAAVIELGHAVRQCADVATEFAPYARVPVLTSVSRLSQVLEQLARVDPAPAGAGAWLERLLTVSADGGIVDAAARMVDGLDRELRAGTLRIDSVLAACAAAEVCADLGQSLLPPQTHRTSANGAGPPAADAWRILQNALFRFDDGSRYSSPAASPTIGTALELCRHLDNLAVAGVSQETVTATRFVVNQLPEIARLTGAAVESWAGSGRLFARARALSNSEEHVLDVIQDRVVVVVPRDIGPVLMTARATARLSASLAAELDRSAGRVGRQPQPQTVAALRAIARPDLQVRDARWATDLAARWDMVRPARTDTAAAPAR